MLFRWEMDMTIRKSSVLISLVSLSAMSATLQANPIELTATYQTPISLTFDAADNGLLGYPYRAASEVTDSITLPQFNPDWGTLTSVSREFTGGTWSAEAINHVRSGIREYDGALNPPMTFRTNILSTLGGGSDIGVTGSLATRDYLKDTPFSGQGDLNGNSSSSGLSSFIGTGNMLVGLTGVIGIQSPDVDVELLSGQMNTTYALQYKYQVNPTVAIGLNDGSHTPFSDTLRVIPLDSDGHIGIANNVSGTATITRAGSNVAEQLISGMPIYTNDVVETDSDGSVQMNFADGSTLNLSSDARLSMDEYVYDPDASRDGDDLTSLLRKVFVFTSGLIRDVDEDLGESNVVYGNLGIRGDASEYVDPATLDLAVTMNAGSPVSLYTAVDVPDQPFTFGFDYAFFDPSGSLDVTLGGHALFSGSADASTLGDVFHFSTLIDDPIVLNLFLTELSFTYDGIHDSELFLDNIVFPGLGNGDFNNLDANWFSRGEGHVNLVGVTDASLSEQITVPEPGTVWLLASGLLLGWARTGFGKANGR